MLRLITDFDGPIMDVSDRYYRVYQYCLAETKRSDQPVRELPKAEFWDMKRARVPETEIGILSGLDADQARDFAQKRRQTVHTLPYMVYDRPAPGALETLQKVQRAGVDLAVMTMRRVRELDEAFNRCNLGQFFPENRRYCLPNDYVKTGDVKDKPLLMAKALAELPPTSDTWMVGDTEADIIAAKTHGVKVIGVLCGIRDRTQLEMHQPDLIANNLSEAVEIILGRKN
ncbi:MULTISPECIES: HAD family hydrolase [unclassified Microcoleus]|uniref:HAD family hydrolase n=1 Tax=unclassified Microcoleus TaxID=2642155 RepID=UPI002FD24B40